MSAAAILSRLKESGVSVAVAGDDIRVKGPKSILTPVMLDELREHKPELVLLLKDTPKPAAPTIDAVAERIGAWLEVTDNPPCPCSKAWRDLADATADFALGVWAYPALIAGWGDGALLAVDEGLVSEKLRRGFHLMNIDSNAATLMTGKGELEHFRRPRTAAPPWWRDPRVAIAAHNASAHAARKGN